MRCQSPRQEEKLPTLLPPPHPMLRHPGKLINNTIRAGLGLYQGYSRQIVTKPKGGLASQTPQALSVPRFTRPLPGQVP